MCIEKVSLNEVRPLLQTRFVELSTEVTVKIRVSIDNVSEENITPNPTLTTLIYFNDDKGDKGEYGIMAEGTMSDLLSIEDVSHALCIPLDTQVWDMRVLEAG